MATATRDGATTAAPTALPDVNKGTNWETALLDLLGAPATPDNYQFLNAWATREHGSSYPASLYANNPFFTTAGGGGTVGPLAAGTYPTIPNTPGVASYPNVATGDLATALHIRSEYPGILAAIRSGKPEQYASNPQFQQELSTWSGSGYSGLSVGSSPSAPEGPATEATILGSGSVANDTKASSWFGQALHGVGFAFGVPQTKSLLSGGQPGSPEANAIAAINSVPKFLAWITDTKNLMRLGEMVAGGVLVILGTVAIIKGGSGSPTTQTKGAVRTVAKAVPATRAVAKVAR